MTTAPLGYVLAAPVLVTAAELIEGPVSANDLIGLDEIRTAATLPGCGLVTVEINADGTVSFGLPRIAECRGIAGSAAALIAQELSVPRLRVRITPIGVPSELVPAQLSGVAEPTDAVRVAGALARQRLLAAAAGVFGVGAAAMRIGGGVVTGPGGRELGIGALTGWAAAARTSAVPKRS